MGWEKEERLARLALQVAYEPGMPLIAQLVAEEGAVAAAAGLQAADPGRPWPDVEALLAQGEATGARYVIPGDSEWPRQLGMLRVAESLQDKGGVPLGLWVKGPARLTDLTGAVAVVGSRSATTYGADVAGDMGAGLSKLGRPVVSGAAFGIDQAAHRGCLAAGGAPTVAVLACGIDRVYPEAHRRLIEEIARVGAVITEQPPGAAPMRHRFLSRNRIVAGLTCGTVVVEAAVRSGAMSTAGWTERLALPLMGVPGPVNSAASQGVHVLIQNGARLVCSAAEVDQYLTAQWSGMQGTAPAEVRRAGA